MSLIEDENLEAITGWSKKSALTKISGIINTVVRRGINLNYV
jgi:hypothetical protein